MKRWGIGMLGTLLLLSSALVMAQLPEASFKFLSFDAPANVFLSVDQINNLQTVVGYYQTTTSPSAIEGFAYFPFGQQFVTLINPNTAPVGGTTYVYGENNLGTIVGQYLTATNSFAGFFLKNGKYTTYTVPGYTGTTVTAVNDEADFAGYLQNAAGIVGFTVVKGKRNLITIEGITTAEPFCINNLDVVAGFYMDSKSIYHGFLLDTKGKLTTIDVPGASTAAGFGTILLGLNNFGVVSGHFYDGSVTEHGFVRTPDGQFFQVDVPNAEATSGGGINDFGVMVGHYVN